MCRQKRSEPKIKKKQERKEKQRKSEENECEKITKMKAKWKEDDKKDSQQCCSVKVCLDTNSTNMNRIPVTTK